MIRLALAALWLVLACDSSAPARGSDIGVTCRDTDECAEGLVCTEGRCVKPSGNEDKEDDAGASVPHIFLSEQKALDFGAPLIGSPVTKTVDVTNIGDAVLEISNLRLTEDDDLLEYNADPSGKVDIRLSTGTLETLSVTVVAQDDEVDTGSLCIITNDPETPEMCLALLADVKGETDLCAVPMEVGDVRAFTVCEDPADSPLIFSGVALGETGTQLLMIYNGGTENRPITIQAGGIYVTDTVGDGDPPFGVEVFTDAERTEEPTYPVYLTPLGKVEPIALYISVHFDALEEGALPDERLVVEYTGDEGLTSESFPIGGSIIVCPEGQFNADNNPYNGCECSIDEETCNGTDDDCDGVIDNGCDDDLDGYCEATLAVSEGAAVCPLGPGDCDDNDASINPGAVESCDGLDNDCDSHAPVEGIDEGCDDDGDGYCDSGLTLVGLPDVCPNGGGDCDDNNPLTSPNAPEACDGEDNGCDSGDIDVGCDDDGDGYCDSAMDVVEPAAACPAGPGDCDDNNFSVHPDATEDCDDIDNDCNEGGIDDGCDVDGDGWCAAGKTTVGTPASCPAGGGDCNDADDTVYPGATELCDDQRNDCTDQTADIGCDDDGDGFCDEAMGFVSGSDVCPLGDGDCNDTLDSVYPGAIEVCDDMRNDCSLAAADEGCDDDGDGWCDATMELLGSSLACPLGGDDCNDVESTVYPGAEEICDGRRNDCSDGLADSGCDDDNDDYCDSAMTVGDDGAPTCPHSASGEMGDDCADDDSSQHPGVDETCYNNADDNCSGEADEGCPVCGDYFCDLARGECRHCSLDCAPAPSDCNMDGDGLPPTTCTGPNLTAADNVKCVCPSGSDCSTVCDASYSTISAAFASLPSTVSTPTYISIYAGTYAGGINLTGKTISGSLWIGAACNNGTRESPVTVTSSASVDYILQFGTISNVTLDGIKLSIDGTSDVSAIAFGNDCSSGNNTNVKLRYLTITSNSSGARFVNNAWGCDLPGLVVEEVDAFATTNGLTMGGIGLGASGSIVRRVSICGSDTTGRGLGGSANGRIERTLVKNYRGDNSWGIVLGGADVNMTIDGVVAQNNTYGIGGYETGLTLRNTRINGGTAPFTPGTNQAEIFNNLIGGGYWWDMNLLGPSTVPRLSWNTFYGPANAGRQAVLDRVTIAEFRANLLLDNVSEFLAWLRMNSPKATTAFENRYFNNTAGNCGCSGSPCGSAVECLEDAPIEENPQTETSLSGWKYYLNQTTSPAKDASSALASAICSGGVCLSDMTTATNGTDCEATVLDTGQADLGYHYLACMCEPYETCSDGVDNDGNGLVDDGCP